MARPRHLHFAVFLYYVLSGGRFTAPFLEHVAGFKNDSLVGISLALQVGIGGALGPFAGSLADGIEMRCPRRGRALVLVSGVMVGTVAFVLHGVVRWACPEEAASHQTSYCSPRAVICYHFALRVIYAVGNSFTYPVLNGITLAFLAEDIEKETHAVGQGQTSNYGKERVHGAYSWALASVIMGPIIDRFGFTSMFFFAPVSAIYCLITVIVFIQGLEERRRGTNDGDVASMDSRYGGDGRDVCANECNEQGYPSPHPEGHHQSCSTVKLLSIVCGTVYGFGFMFSLITLRMGTSIVESLIFLFFEKLEGSYTLMGVTVAVTVMFEVPIFYLAPMLIDRFGPGRLQKVACLAYIVRVVGYTLIPTGSMGWVLFLEPLHGVTYGCAATSSVEYFVSFTPKGQEAAGQGLLSALEGVGGVIGLAGGGWAEDAFGPKMMYRGFAAMVATGCGIFAATDAWRGRYHRLREMDDIGRVELTNLT